jgi:sortase A
MLSKALLKARKFIVMHYQYRKAPPSSVSFFKRLDSSPRFKKTLPFLLIIIGLSLVGFVAAPILSYQLFVAPRFSLVKPVPNDQSSSPVVLAEETPDYTQPINWFPTAPKLPSRPSRITHYTLSIPKLEIEDAIVEIGGEDLKQTLIQYEGTAFPGQFGNTVIFGHSVLPQFFNPENYLTIFSTLPTLEVGDEVLVDFDGVHYQYLVKEMVEVEPEDISILEQRYDNSCLTLITCVPPGTYLKRLAVYACLTRR